MAYGSEIQMVHVTANKGQHLQEKKVIVVNSRHNFTQVITSFTNHPGMQKSLAYVNLLLLAWFFKREVLEMYNQ